VTHNNSLFWLPRRYNLFIWHNAILMLIGLFFFQWRPAIIVFAYVFETIFIGLMHVVKLWVVFRFGKAQKEIDTNNQKNKNNEWGMIPFFIAHYFFFIFVQSVFIFSFLGGSISGIDKDSFNVFKNYQILLQEPDMLMAIGCIIASQIAFSVRNFFIEERYHQYTLGKLFMQPYPRIIIQQFVSIFSGFLLFIASGALAIGVAVILIVSRLLLDLYLVALMHNESLMQGLLKKISADGKLKRISAKDIEVFLD
jgi:hypothetical protein